MKLVILMLLLPLTAYANDNTDPTKPLTLGSVAEQFYDGELKLGSIISINGEPSAFINGKKVVVGDMVGDYQLTSIGKSSVVLEKNGEKIQLKMFTQSVVKNNEK